MVAAELVAELVGQPGRLGMMEQSGLVVDVPDPVVLNGLLVDVPPKAPVRLPSAALCCTKTERKQMTASTSCAVKEVCIMCLVMLVACELISGWRSE